MAGRDCTWVASDEPIHLFRLVIHLSFSYTHSSKHSGMPCVFCCGIASSVVSPHPHSLLTLLPVPPGCIWPVQQLTQKLSKQSCLFSPWVPFHVASICWEFLQQTGLWGLALHLECRDNIAYHIPYNFFRLLGEFFFLFIFSWHRKLFYTSLKAQN